MKITDTINGIDFSLPPIWFMRQAGRYLPEYRALRETTSDFISYCLDSDKASEATLQPITRFDFDAAIIFSDILMIPWAMNRNVRFIPGEGPKLDPLSHPKDLVVPDSNEMIAKLQPVLDAIKKTRSALSDEKALIGFCGAPWTVSTYMMEGGSSRD
ncbi:MAG: uroporphyrinogen decarboxylase family protein, partial [Candidatus Puniceispirillales bacterium]